MTSTLLRDENGHSKALFGIAKDITEIKRVEEKLRESEKKYRAIFDKAIEGILIAKEGRIALANAALEKMIGHNKEIIASKPFTEFIHPEDREMVHENYKKE
ncbi:MAG: PAS domain-containing protein [Desulfobacterales bacterium]